MSHFKRVPPISPVLLTAVLVLLGAAAVLAGVYMLVGLPFTLIIGGASAVAVGLFADTR